MLRSHAIVLLRQIAHETRLVIRTDQMAHHRHRATCIQHMHHRLAVEWRDLHRSMSLAGGCATDQQGNLHPEPLHLAGHMNHLIQRRSDQSAESDHVDAFLHGGLQNFRARDHHAEVDDLVVIAAQHHADDVLANVMNITLHRGHEDFSLSTNGLAGRERRRLLGFHEGKKIRHRLLHHAS